MKSKSQYGVPAQDDDLFKDLGHQHYHKVIPLHHTSQKKMKHFISNNKEYFSKTTLLSFLKFEKICDTQVN